MFRAYYDASVGEMLDQSVEAVVGTLALRSQGSIRDTETHAWEGAVGILQGALGAFRDGHIYLEFALPRVGRRIDALLLVRQVIFVIEFKVGEEEFRPAAIDQVWDYALDLKNFHETSHDKAIVPLLIPTKAPTTLIVGKPSPLNDGVISPAKVSPDQLAAAVASHVRQIAAPAIDRRAWEGGRYNPTPTIIEAAKAMYAGHQVLDIYRNDAAAKNLTETFNRVQRVIERAKEEQSKCICFVTGVPGAGKTLVGLNVATAHLDAATSQPAVFLSGNQPLVDVLRESLAVDSVRRSEVSGNKIRKGLAHGRVKLFIQNVHHFRDTYLVDSRAPTDGVAVFDEAQRAWNQKQTADFMRRKKDRPDFNQSEAEFLLSCMDRRDWAAVICLVGGGQEINKGEAGISAWIDAVIKSFPHWHVHISPNLRDSEYSAGEGLARLASHKQVFTDASLHLGVSMRSFRSEHLSAFVKAVLDSEVESARASLERISPKYPVVLTRSLDSGKAWVRQMARGSERVGMVVSSKAQRLKPLAVDVRVETNPVRWFLLGKNDVRSSNYLEDAATEFQVQGLELDWTCVVWDADLRRAGSGWSHHSFRGSKWKRILNHENQTYLKNAYRVLLTRARQGMAIVVPTGDSSDPTRDEGFYNSTFEYLRSLGLQVI